jgi:hypothetical protein
VTVSLSMLSILSASTYMQPCLHCASAHHALARGRRCCYSNLSNRNCSSACRSVMSNGSYMAFMACAFKAWSIHLG